MATEILTQKEGGQALAHPSLSVVMAVHDEAELLEQHLPLFLEQPCSSAYEVIVVDDASTDNTPDILMRLKAQYPQLYSTFIPKSVPNPCRQRLALTIGAKAVHNDWVLLADIKRPPLSVSTFEHLMQTAANYSPLAITLYFGKSDDAPTRYQIWDDLEDAAPLLRKAERRSGRGHMGKRLKVCRGQYDAIAVPSQYIHDALRYFDHQIKGLSLMKLRFHVANTSTLNKTIKLGISNAANENIALLSE